MNILSTSIYNLVHFFFAYFLKRVLTIRLFSSSYNFHKHLAGEGVMRFRCEFFSAKTGWDCKAAIHVKENQVIKVLDVEHVCRQPDASRYYKLKVSLYLGYTN